MDIEQLNLDFEGDLTAIETVEKIVCHHPAHTTWDARDIHEFHRDERGWDGAGYNYFVTKDGRVQEMRGRNVGAHTAGWNDRTLGVCFQGNFNEEEVTEAQIEAGGWLIAKLLEEEGLSIDDIVGHNDLTETSCPGENFPLEAMRASAEEYVNEGGESEMLDRAIVINSYADFPVAELLANRLEAPIYTRTVAQRIQVAEEIFVVGGSEEDLEGDNFTVLSGDNRFETAARVSEYLSS